MKVQFFCNLRKAQNLKPLRPQISISVLQTRTQYPCVCSLVPHQPQTTQYLTTTFVTMFVNVCSDARGPNGIFEPKSINPHVSRVCAQSRGKCVLHDPSFPQPPPHTTTHGNAYTDKYKHCLYTDVLWLICSLPNSTNNTTPVAVRQSCFVKTLRTNISTHPPIWGPTPHRFHSDADIDVINSFLAPAADAWHRHHAANNRPGKTAPGYVFITLSD